MFEEKIYELENETNKIINIFFVLPQHICCKPNSGNNGEVGKTGMSRTTSSEQSLHLCQHSCTKAHESHHPYLRQEKLC